MVKTVCQSFVIVTCKSYSPAFVNLILKHSSSVLESESDNEEVNKSQILLSHIRTVTKGNSRISKISLVCLASVLY